MSAATRQLTGSCLCGAARYRVADEFAYAFNCHCSQCRRATGSAFKPFAGVLREKLTLLQGGDALLRYGDATTHDVHCGKCGSLLYSDIGTGPYLHVTLGTLLEAPSLKPTAHIFVGSKAPWHEITDDLPRHREFPPAP